MAETALHIIVEKAGDPEKLGALVKAAIETQETLTKTVVPNGYRCVECYANNGSHEPNCSCGVVTSNMGAFTEGEVS